MVLFKNKTKKELELKQIPKSGPETMSPLETENAKVHIPQLTNTLEGKIKETQEKEEQKDGICDSDNSKFL